MNEEKILTENTVEEVTACGEQTTVEEVNACEAQAPVDTEILVPKTEDVNPTQTTKTFGQKIKDHKAEIVAGGGALITGILIAEPAKRLATKAVDGIKGFVGKLFGRTNRKKEDSEVIEGQATENN